MYLPKVALKSDFYSLKTMQSVTFVSQNMCSKFIRNWNNIAPKRQLNNNCTWNLRKIGNEATKETKTYTVIIFIMIS